ncbi:hypothetical protein HT031_001294 [Scenedesmus sp. PABB004]|nr:hypothetical protein HT031_001294 [Scenedesmus sp. PABB004]
MAAPEQPNPLSSTWPAAAGGLPPVLPLRAADAPLPAAAGAPLAVLARPAGAGPCVVTLRRAALQGCDGALAVVSSARVCEVAAATPASGGAAAYITTLRGAPGPQGFEVVVDLQVSRCAGEQQPGRRAARGAGTVGRRRRAAPRGNRQLLHSTWERLELRLASLQGDKDACTLWALAALPPSDAAATAGPEGGGGGAGRPAGALMSQVDELRLLNASLLHAHPGDAQALPESLRLLQSKAAAQPTPGGGAAAIKSLSALLAKGALLQAQQQAAGQREQRRSSTAHAGAEGPALPGLRGAAAPGPPADGAAGGGDEAVLAAVARLEARLDRLEARVDARLDALGGQLLAGVGRLESRLAALEARAGAAQAPPG